MAQAFFVESTFWYYIARQIWDDVRAHIPEALAVMNERARSEGLPIVWDQEPAAAWATCCRIFAVTKEYAQSMNRREFEAMRRGASATKQPSGFFDEALQRLLANLREPALPNREMADTIADTFACGSVQSTGGATPPAPLQIPIIQWIITDEVVHFAAMLAVSRDASHWSAWVESYGQLRPGWWRRTFSNADTWLFPYPPSAV